jgi:hypothetical protein
MKLNRICLVVKYSV